MSSIDAFFENKKYQMPIIFESDNLTAEVEKLLDEYILDLENAGVDTDLISKVRVFKEYSHYTLSFYLRGIHSVAFDYFEKAIEVLDITHSQILVSDFKERNLFRGRENSDAGDYTDLEMYHIPLNKRGIIATQRYSFPGLPCLYAGASVYTCWIEMNRPSFEKFQVATIKTSDTARKKKVLDLSNIPQRLNQIKDEEWFDENEYYLYWPLLTLCSIKSRHDNNPFKPEYIFPQFMLEYILLSKNIDEIMGIKYASIKAASINEKQFDDDWHTYINYVFPTHSDSMSEDICSSLRNLFVVEHNRSGKELQILTRLLEIDNARTKVIDLDAQPTKEDAIASALNKRHIYTRDGKMYSYVLSAFGMIEMALLRDKFDDIEEDTIKLQPISEAEINRICQ